STPCWRTWSTAGGGRRRTSAGWAARWGRLPPRRSRSTGGRREPHPARPGTAGGARRGGGARRAHDLPGGPADVARRAQGRPGPARRGGPPVGGRGCDGRRRPRAHAVAGGAHARRRAGRGVGLGPRGRRGPRAHVAARVGPPGRRPRDVAAVAGGRRPPV